MTIAAAKTLTLLVVLSNCCCCYCSTGPLGYGRCCCQLGYCLTGPLGSDGNIVALLPQILVDVDASSSLPRND
jgi:hypothetical protein